MTSILEDKFCYYCQREYTTPKRLQNHILKKHIHTYAYWTVIDAIEDSVKEALERNK